LQGNDITRIGPLFPETHPSKLTYLNVGHNPLGEEGGLELGRALAYNNELSTLYANNCSFNLKGLLAVITSLNENDTLVTLELDRPLLSIAKEEESMTHISKMLLNKFCHLNHLSLRLHGIGDAVARLHSHATSLSNALTWNPTGLV
jgi:Ran GTPase-activating protein (RanGAP) involved in mRNA processing and transport